MVSALVDTQCLAAVRQVFLTESTTIGVRHSPVMRDTLERTSVEVALPDGIVRLKIARRGRDIMNVAPEYEDCLRMARDTGRPLKLIFQEAVAAYYRDL